MSLIHRPFVLTVALAGLLLLSASGPRAQDAREWSRRDARRQEIAVKTERLMRFMKDRELDGVLIRRVRNFQWLTAGVSNQIVITDDVGPAALLILRDGRRFLLTNPSEGFRLMDEDLRGLGFTWARHRWYEELGPENVFVTTARRFAGSDRIGSDTPMPGLIDVAADLDRLHFPLTPQEIAKYRWLGRASADAVRAVIDRIRPGMSEREIAALVYQELTKRQIQPTVVLIGVDRRIYRYRHATPSDARLQKYAMVNICAERWGLVVALTRFVHFGPLPEELQQKIRATARIAATLLDRTRPGRTAPEIFAMLKKAYADVGYPDEWQNHHQGGAIGYWEREWLLHPGSQARVEAYTAFAWNPTITGAKVEDTFLVLPEGNEVITTIPGWPTITVKIGDRAYAIPTILVRKELETTDP